MQIQIPDSWLRDYLETDATPKQIQEALSLCGPSVERLHEKDGDYIYDTEVTTNRVDCMSVIGIAFECVAILPRFGYTASLKKDPYQTKSKLKVADKVDYLTVKLDKKLCPRFSAALIKNVQVGPSPTEVVKRLELAGLRSLNNVVDISNYLMLEMGQPVHTFDYDKIAGHKMVLRESEKGERLVTLDGKEHTLPGGDVVIEDGSKNLIDLCGIMGGKNSAVDENTKNVLLFVQVYEPVHIRKTSMGLAHRTDAAVLFEKTLPVENVLPTLEYGIGLFNELTGGKAASEVLDILSIPEGNSTIKLPSPITKFTSVRLGVDLSLSEITKILKSLEFKVHSETEIEVPWVRKNDVTIPEDVVEEIARIYGYHNLPSQLMAGELPTNRPNDAEFYWVGKIKQALKYWGFTETYTYSLVDQDSGLKLKNPLSSDWVYLRTNLVDSHKRIIAENLGRVPELNLFEIANIYLPQKNGLPKEELRLTITSTNKGPNDLNELIKTLLSEVMGVQVGFMGSNEINLSDLIPKATIVRKFTPISQYQSVIEDVTLTLSENYDDLKKKIYKLSNLIKQIDVIDDSYLPKVTLRITYHDEKKQLSKEDVAPIRSILEKGFPS